MPALAAAVAASAAPACFVFQGKNQEIPDKSLYVPTLMSAVRV